LNGSKVINLFKFQHNIFVVILYSTIVIHNNSKIVRADYFLDYIVVS